MSASILAVATMTTEQSMSQTEATDIAQTLVGATLQSATVLPTLFRATRIDRRGSVLLEPRQGRDLRQSFYQPARNRLDRGPSTAQRMERYADQALPLAAAAAGRALASVQLPPERVTHLVTVSCTGFYAPGLDIGLIDQLRLQPTVGRLHVGFMGCHGMLNALAAAQSLVEADPDRRVLVCAVELCTLHLQYGWEPDSVVANALFADGAASLVLGSAQPSGENCWILSAVGSCLLPDCQADMTWRIGDHGFEMRLSARVPELIEQHLGCWLKAWLRQQGTELAEIGSWAVHPGGPRILRSVADALGLAQEAMADSANVLAAHGNMSSPTIGFILERLMQRAARRPCVALAFGPGLVVEAALLT